MADLRADLLSGDATKQTGALMNTFAMLVGAGLSLCCAAGAGAVMLLRDAWAAADGRQRCCSGSAAMTVSVLSQLGLSLCLLQPATAARA